MQLPVPTTADGTYTERYVLAVFFFALGGQSWQHQINFLNGDHICTWFQEFKRSGANGEEQPVLFGLHGCKKNDDGDLVPSHIYIRTSITMNPFTKRFPS